MAPKCRAGGGVWVVGGDGVRSPRSGPRPLAGQAPAIAVIAVGGAIGALARHGVGLALPQRPVAIPLATAAVNVVGCLLIGSLMVVITELTMAHPLVRPFLATGILGGFTTFSTYATDVEELLRAGRVGPAALYLVGTLVGAVAATWLGITFTRRLAALHGRRRSRGRRKRR